MKTQTYLDAAQAYNEAAEAVKTRWQAYLRALDTRDEIYQNLCSLLSAEANKKKGASR